MFRPDRRVEDGSHHNARVFSPFGAPAVLQRRQWILREMVDNFDPESSPMEIISRLRNASNLDTRGAEDFFQFRQSGLLKIFS